MGPIGERELIIVAIIVLILFGGKKLPQLGRGMGESVKELKKVFKSSEKDSN